MRYERILSSLYPTGKCFKALLPAGDGSKVFDLSAYGLECQGLINCGTFSAVYRAYDSRGNDCAVKVTSLLNDDIPPETVAKLTLREIDICTEMMRRHTPGVMPVYRYYPGRSKIQSMVKNAKNKKESELANFLITEVMPLGLPYDVFIKKLARGRIFSEEETAALMLDMMTSLVNIHNRRVIHRDIKPGNLLLIQQEDGQVRVVFGDFNASKEFPDEVDNSFTCVGTKGYIHPDILALSGSVGRGTAERGDVYSVGVIIYQILNGGIRPSDVRILQRPKNCPSERIFRLLDSMLCSRIDDIPTSTEIISELLQITENGEVPAAVSARRERVFTDISLEDLDSFGELEHFEFPGFSAPIAQSFKSGFEKFSRVFSEFDKRWQ